MITRLIPDFDAELTVAIERVEELLLMLAQAEDDDTDDSVEPSPVPLAGPAGSGVAAPGLERRDTPTGPPGPSTPGTGGDLHRK